MVLLPKTRPLLLRKRLPVLSFVSSGVLSNTGSTRTSSTVNIGSPFYIATRRVIVVCTSASSANGPLVSATINGAPATIHVDTEPNATQINIISALVPSGTTNVTLTLTYSGSQFATSGYAVYNVDNSLLSSVTPNTGIGASTPGVTTISTTAITTLPGGFIVAGCTIGAASTGLAFTGMTTDAFGTTNTGVISSSGSLLGGSLTPTATWGSSQSCSVGAAAWR